jgi:sugar phosphate isomerase/epimerase
MLRGISKAGLGQQVGADDNLIKKAAQYGFQTIDLDARSLIEQHGLEQAQQLLHSNSMQLGSINLSVEWRGTEEQFQSSLVGLAASASAAQALGCTACCTYVLPSTDLNAAHFMALATRRLRICAEVLGAYHIRLGLEFVGPHHLRTRWANPFIWTMDETLDWIETIGLSNVGLLFDAYHWYTTSNRIEDILSLQANQIVHVHINDAPNLPIEQVLDNGRVYPGEGVINLAGFLQSLQQIGYQGSVTQEILNAEPPQGSLEELLERSKEGYDKVYTAAGLA